jgi:putative transposase
MLGFQVSERSVSRWMRRALITAGPSQGWLRFLRNHREAIAAMDFFTVPTVTFSLLYYFFLIGHDRRRILHFNVTRHPTSAWIVQQLREAFPYEPAIQFLLLDHDAKYGIEVPAAIRSMGITTVRTAVGCPWQNSAAERWVGTCRRELLEHVIAFNPSHMKRLLAFFIDYYHQDRTHCTLQSRLHIPRTPRVVEEGLWRGRVSVVFIIVTTGLRKSRESLVLPPRLPHFLQLCGCL